MSDSDDRLPDVEHGDSDDGLPDVGHEEDDAAGRDSLSDGNRLRSFNSVLDEVKAFETDEQLREWLIQVLDKRSTGAKRLPNRWPRHAFVSRIYRKSDTLLKERFGRVYSHLLQSFEPGTASDGKAHDAERELLFNLVSLSSTIRTEQAKARLMRWLRNGAYRDWEYGTFNLYNEILLATSAYDPDEAWLSYICDSLPTKPYYERVALASYRALLQTQGIGCLELLPQVLGAVDPRHEKKRKSFGYLLGLTISRFGAEVFLDKATEALKRNVEDAAEACSNALRLEDFLEDAFSEAQAEQLKSCVERLRRSVLDPAIERLQSLEADEKADALHNLVKKKPPETIYRFRWRDGCALVFPRRFEVVIDEPHALSLLDELDDYNQVDPLSVGIDAMSPPKMRSMAAYAGTSAGGLPVTDEDDLI
ncbi:MAG TPA: hypothetical protein VGP08_23560 [Pyrinomonadaceae bacterium]|jgi:hypothetical protein|nr:hypothetical protein [Pyrinomonadaceae bacterium]